MEKWRSAVENNLFFEARKYFLKLLPSIKDVKMNMRMRTKKYAVDSAIEFFTKLILLAKVFTETTRQRRRNFITEKYEKRFL